jgi:hypothetical protein
LLFPGRGIRTAKLENAKDADDSKALPQYSPELIKQNN